MTRFQASGGRHVHRRPGGPAATYPGIPAPPTRSVGSWPLPAAPDPPSRPRGADVSSLRTGLTVAAVAGGVLALAASTVAITTAPGGPGSPTEPDTTLRLAAGDDPAPTARPAVLQMTMLPAVEQATVLPPALEVASLVKAARMTATTDTTAQSAEQAARTTPRADRTAAARCDGDLDGLGRVKPWARTAARFLSCLYDEPALVGGAGRADRSDDPSDLAVDIMVRGPRGDRIAACALANREELGIDSVAWRQRANDGDGWERLSDRGDDTANHRDHVHIRFERAAPDGDPLAGRCR